jgi:hypothetical protein
MFFSEEKNQKTFIFYACPNFSVRRLERCVAARNKAFLLLFLQKKKVLPSNPRS